MKELIEIQRELKAPKGQTNSFGNYKYRSCEDILEAVKPLCVKHKCLLTLSDEMIMLGDRFYVKATARLVRNSEIDDKTVRNMIGVSAYAREQEKKMNKDGTKEIMDHSQLTGSASSYARKYALNGLFCIDDTKDADTMDNTAQSFEQYKKEEVKQMESIQKSILKDLIVVLDAINTPSTKKAAIAVNELLGHAIVTYSDAESLIKKVNLTIEKETPK